MSISKIEWLRSNDGKPGYTFNPVRGLCPVGCSYCYARRMYQSPRYPALYKQQEIRFVSSVLTKDIAALIKKPPSRVFIGSTMELFGPWVKDEWMKSILEYCTYLSKHTFIFLTKRPEDLAKWSPFPKNTWVGVSATDWAMMQRGTGFLRKVDALVKFISFEPLLHWQEQNPEWLIEDWRVAGISWIILGQQTPSSAKTAPKVGWIRDIVESADRAGIPLFLKENLQPLFGNPNPNVPNLLETWWGMANCIGTNLRHEFPGPAQFCGIQDGDEDD